MTLDNGSAVFQVNGSKLERTAMAHGSGYNEPPTGRVAFLVCLPLVQAIMVLLLTSALWVEEQLSQEMVLAEAVYGKPGADELVEETDSIYRKLFYDSGAIARSYRITGQALAVDAGRWDDWLTRTSGALDGRLDTLWWLIYLALYRIRMLAYWMTFLSPLLIAALVDGLMQREIKKKELGYSSPLRYHTAWNVLILLSVLPVVYLMLPLSVHPLVIPFWAVAFSINGTLLFSNLQKRL